MSEKKGLSIRKPDDFFITILAPQGYEWLREDLKKLIEEGKVACYDVNEKPELLEKAGLGDMKPEEVDEPIVIVSTPDSEEGEMCALSAIGESIIVHCEETIVPLKEKARRKHKKGAVPLGEVAGSQFR